MTCWYFRSLVDDLVDHELPLSLENAVREHLAVCSDCRKEYDQSVRLKAVLSEFSVPEPEPGYWQESAALIRALTIEAPALVSVPAEIGQRSRERRSFYRSLAAVAASLTLFFGSLMIDSPWGNTALETAAIQSPEYPAATSTATARVMGGGYILEDEQALIARSVLLVGTPGMAFTRTGMLGAMGTDQKH